MSDHQHTTDIFDISEKVGYHTSANPFIALEFYPPRTESAVEKLKSRLLAFQKLKPLYVDFTWGAGGTTSDLTMDLCLTAQSQFGYVANMHLTCTNMPREKVDIALKVASQKNIKNILALRGDPPVGQLDWKPVESGFACALDLILYIKQFEREKKVVDFFNITVAGYPEGHPSKINVFASDIIPGSEVDLSKYNLTSSEKGRVVQIENELMVCFDKDFASELDYLKKKVDAGAKMIITQMFYDADVYISFVEACRKHGITVPIIPGVMCVTNYGGFQRMIGLCRTRVPKAVSDAFEAAKDDPERMKQAGIQVGVDMCKKLLDAGAPGLHFYTLNLDEVVVGILRGLNLYQGDYEESNEIQ